MKPIGSPGAASQGSPRGVVRSPAHRDTGEQDATGGLLVSRRRCSPTEVNSSTGSEASARNSVKSGGGVAAAGVVDGSHGASQAQFIDKVVGVPLV